MGAPKSSRCEAARREEFGVFLIYASMTSDEDNEADGLFQQPVDIISLRRPKQGLTI